MVAAGNPTRNRISRNTFLLYIGQQTVLVVQSLQCTKGGVRPPEMWWSQYRPPEITLQHWQKYPDKVVSPFVYIALRRSSRTTGEGLA